jgi:hypothetical protein
MLGSAESLDSAPVARLVRGRQPLQHLRQTGSRLPPLCIFGHDAARPTGRKAGTAPARRADFLRTPVRGTLVAVGYVPKWIPLLEAIQHVQRVAGSRLDEACDALLSALCDGGVASRYRGEDIGGAAALIEGGGGGVPAARWYGAMVVDDGRVEFGNSRYYPSPRRARYTREEIEVQRHDLLRWWPEPTENATEEPRAANVSPRATADEPNDLSSSADAPLRQPTADGSLSIASADAQLHDAALVGEAAREPETAEATLAHQALSVTASYPDVKAAVKMRGQATEAELKKAVRVALPDKHVPRDWVRRARDELFGKPDRGRPKSAK